MSLATTLKKYRTRKGLTQHEFAEMLKVGRSTLAMLETGKQSKVSAEFLQAFKKITGGEYEGALGDVAPNKEKFAEMILFYLTLAGKNKSIPKTKLAKLLYLADFAWYKKNLSSMSNMQYRKIQFGPVPDMYFRCIDELFENDFITITPSKKALLIALSKKGEAAESRQLQSAEKKLMQKIEKKWHSKNTAAIVDFTHMQVPYLATKDDFIMNYDLITQEPGDLY